MSTELLVRVLSSELPLDGSLQRVSYLQPSIDLGAQELAAVDTPVQALPAEDADLDLRHVQPTRVLGRVVEFDPAQEPCRCARSQHVVEALPEVGVSPPAECHHQLHWRAHQSVGRMPPYDLWNRNCEHYATWLMGEEPQSAQVTGAFVLGLIGTFLWLAQ